MHGIIYIELSYFVIKTQFACVNTPRKEHTSRFILQSCYLGFTAILGDLITLPAYAIVWWRVLITSISLIFLIRMRQAILALSTRMILTYMGIGVLVGLHWVCFYGAIKLSNASLTLVCMATSALFTSFLEPLIMGQRLKWLNILLGLIVIPGMFFVVNGIDVTFYAGLWAGLAAAFFAALFAALNKRYIHGSSPMTITFLELSSAWLFLTIVAPFFVSYHEIISWIPIGMDIWYLLILALLCTTLAYVLAIRSLLKLSAFASNLVINLEPIYGIVLAWLILDDHKELTSNFYIGMIVIFATIILYPMIQRHSAKVKKKENKSI